MIQLKTKLKLADNSGAQICECLKIYKTNFAYTGTFLLVSIKTIKAQSKLKKSDLYKAIVVRTSFKSQRSDNTFIKFNENAIILLNKKNDLISSRILGPVAIELRKQSLVKILSLSSVIF